ncbi:phage protein NinX family protein [Providencia stuartii]|uniref:Phage recombination protein n=1 Tax=Providencia stuartii (strain MRSN 2154) TaxID=1157951 RepID=A0A140NSG0_PROSM|nr:phage protein NinX family protein [Providencia stuartii]AFH95146.1 phage recombination protein [Providencia stuartii MRSN 2154]
MNKYTELSDAEINVKVFINLYGKESLKDKDMRRYFSRVDYCNNPADAMPIIIENKLTLSPRYDSDEWISESLFYHDIYSVNKNLYRAAMEVFLMMKDAENEKV